MYRLARNGCARHGKAWRHKATIAASSGFAKDRLLMQEQVRAGLGAAFHDMSEQRVTALGAAWLDIARQDNASFFTRGKT